MLLRLTLGEFVIVERAELAFAPGLNALTGETGAGKSILVDAIGLLAGSRGSAEWIRRGAERLVVEGALDLADAPAARDAAFRHGIPLEDGLLLVRREIAADGRSRCFAGGRQVLVSQLARADRRRAVDRRAGGAAGLDRSRRAGGVARPVRRPSRAAGALPGRARGVCPRRSSRVRGSRRCGHRSPATPTSSGRRSVRSARPIRSRASARACAAPWRAGARRVADAALAEELEARLFREEGSVLDHLETLVHRLGAADAAAWGALRAELESLRDAVRALPLPSADDEEEGDLEAMEERLQLLERVCRRYGGDAGAAGADFTSGAAVDVSDGAAAVTDGGSDDPASAAELAAERSVLARLASLEDRLAEGESLDERLAAAEARREAARRDLAVAGSELSRRRASAGGGACRSGRRRAGRAGHAGRVRCALPCAREPDPLGVPAGESGACVRPLENGLERVRLMFQSHPARGRGDLARTRLRRRALPGAAGAARRPRGGESARLLDPRRGRCRDRRRDGAPRGGEA